MCIRDRYVYLVENPDTFDADAVGEYLDLGLLKATTGDQEYEIPAGADLAKYGGLPQYSTNQSHDRQSHDNAYNDRDGARSLALLPCHCLHSSRGLFSHLSTLCHGSLPC